MERISWEDEGGGKRDGKLDIFQRERINSLVKSIWIKELSSHSGSQILKEWKWKAQRKTQGIWHANTL